MSRSKGRSKERRLASAERSQRIIDDDMQYSDTELDFITNESRDDGYLLASIGKFPQDDTLSFLASQKELSPDVRESVRTSIGRKSSIQRSLKLPFAFQDSEIKDLIPLY